MAKCQFCAGSGENWNVLPASQASNPYIQEDGVLQSPPKACPECGGTGKNLYPDGPELDNHHRHLESRVLAKKKKRSK